jgi:hypothetical protein
MFMKKFEIVETPEYYLAVSDKKPVNGDTCLDGLEIFSPYEDGDIAVDKFQKIITYKPKGNAPELDLPLLPDIVVEDDIEKLAKEDRLNTGWGDDVDLPYTSGFIRGYEAATKVYSEEDLRKAFKAGINYGTKPYPLNKEFEENFIQSLKHPQTPKFFIAELEDDFKVNDESYVHSSGAKGMYHTHNKKLRTRINSEGKQVLIGKYLYE